MGSFWGGFVRELGGFGHLREFGGLGFWKISVLSAGLRFILL